MVTKRPQLARQSERRETDLGGIRLTTCSRCGGLLVRSFCISPDQGTWEFQIPVWKCLQCGDVFDATILKNRRHSYSHSHN